jgi:hypothetical protein
MHGCVNGGWLMGTAHHNADLPPTIVRPSYELGSTSDYLISDGR